MISRPAGRALPSATALLLALLAGPAGADPLAACRDAAQADAKRLGACAAAIALTREGPADPWTLSDLLVWRGWTLQRMGDVDGALADYAEAEALSPDWSGPLVERAWAYMAMGDEEGAADEILRARGLEPDSVHVIQQTMNILPAAGRWEECLDLAPAAVRLAPADPLTYAYRGRCLQEAGEPTAALLDYRRAAKMGLDEAWSRGNTAGALLAIGRPAEAEAEARAAVALDAADEHALRMLVRSLLHQGDPDGATAAFEAARAQVPPPRELLTNEVGWGLLEAGRAAEGLAITERWLAEAGGRSFGEPAFADTHAHLLAAVGRGEDAAGWFAEAAAMGGPAWRSGYEARLLELGFDPAAMGGFEGALRACAATGAACRLG